MPTYQYACTACDHRFDAVQTFSDASLSVCPECSGSLRKVFSSVGIVFKGSGFYRTDSRAGAGSTVASESKGGSEGSSNGKDSGSSSEKSAKPEKATAGSSSGSSSSGSSGGSSSGGSSSTPAAAAS